MEREVYLYPYSQADARRLGESSLWQASFQANVSCARDIEGAIRACSDTDGSLRPEASQSILDRWGFRRTIFVLTSTLRDAEYERYHAAAEVDGDVSTQGDIRHEAEAEDEGNAQKRLFVREAQAIQGALPGAEDHQQAGDDENDESDGHGRSLLFYYPFRKCRFQARRFLPAPALSALASRREIR